MKECFKCRKTKPLTDFYKHKQMADGHLGKCKECAREDVRLHRRENDSVREYDRQRAKTPKRKAYAGAVARRWNKKNPLGYKAHYFVSNAVRDGRLKRLPCEKCGEARSHAHHEDYANPLDVVWLCAKCHQRHHASKN